MLSNKQKKGRFYLFCVSNSKINHNLILYDYFFFNSKASITVIISLSLHPKCT